MSKSKPSKLFLRDHITTALEEYFSNLDGEPTKNLYKLILEQVESALLPMVMQHVNGNQSRAAECLGINRGTLRKLLAKYTLS